MHVRFHPHTRVSTLAHDSAWVHLWAAYHAILSRMRSQVAGHMLTAGVCCLTRPSATAHYGVSHHCHIGQAAQWPVRAWLFPYVDLLVQGAAIPPLFALNGTVFGLS